MVGGTLVTSLSEISVSMGAWPIESLSAFYATHLASS
jgi:hypothetical protein